MAVKPGKTVSGQGGKEVLGKVIPNPQLKLMDQVREVMRLKHYLMRTECKEHRAVVLTWWEVVAVHAPMFK